ncbi:Transcriptional activator spt7 [Kappamyces sp. JEL0680]|nr:Transcriptional activator spt7 [Kappamyces sp. JEL0680]
MAQHYLSKSQEKLFIGIIERERDFFKSWMSDPSLGWMKTKERAMFLQRFVAADVSEAPLDDDEFLAIASGRILQMISSVMVDLYLFQHDDFALAAAESSSPGSEDADAAEEDAEGSTDHSVPEPIIDDVYYSLEHDLELLPYIEQVIEEGRDELQSKPEAADEAPKPATAPEDMHIDDRKEEESGGLAGGLSDAPQGMKYLMASIKKRGAGPLQLKQIEQVVTEATPSKSKWARNGRQGQEQMIALMEKILESLRNYKAHSFPFLKPVQKKEAPNYYDIIKNPMDLSTVARKVKSFQYPGKEEFAKDLELIWENCFIYNTAEESIYRVHAQAMRVRTEELLKKIPDPHQSDSDDDESKEAFSVTSGLARRGSIDMDRDLLPFASEDVSMDVVMDEPSDHHSVHEKENIVPLNTVTLPREDPSSDACSTVKRWKQETQLYRALKLRGRREQAIQSLSERPAIQPSQTDLDGYLANYQRFRKRTGQMRRLYETAQPERDHSIQRNGYFFPELYTVGIPLSRTDVQPFQPDVNEFLAYEDEATSPIPPAPLPSLSEYPQVLFSSSSKLGQKMLGNLKEYKSIKDIYAKVMAYQSKTSLYDDSPPFRCYSKCWPEEELPAFHLTSSSCSHLSRRSCALVLAHGGFDGASQSSLTALSDLLGEVLLTAGRTVKAFCDHYGSSMSDAEILFHTLAELGIKNPSTLQSYIDHDVIRYGKKLSDLRSRMEAAWTAFEMDEFSTMPVSKDAEDIDFESHADGIMSGNFLDDMNVDFMNLREIGLDIKIPLKLWKKRTDGSSSARLRRGLFASTTVSEETTDKEEAPDLPAPWPPVDPSTQIGLLAALYQRLQTTSGGLVEDDAKPKTKEAKALIKIALSGGRKKIVLSVPKKKPAGTGGDKTKAKKEKSKTERKKKLKKDEQPGALAL